MIHPSLSPARLCLFAIVLAFSSLSLTAQETVFDASGKLTKLTITSTQGVNKLYDFNVAALKPESDKNKTKAAGILVKKIDETLKILTNPNYKPALKKFYEELWPDIAAIRTYLQETRSLLNAGTVPGSPSIWFPSVQSAYNSALASASPNIFSTTYDNTKPFQISISKKDPFNQFVIDYYNTTLPDLNGGGIDRNPEEMSEHLEYLLTEMKTIRGLLALGRQTPVPVDLYDQLKQHHAALTAAGSNFSVIKGMLQKDWFKKWFWFRGGQLRLNPVDFTTDAFLATNPGADLEKAGKFNEFMDSLINRQLRLDSIGNINAFIQKLSLQHTGESVFSFQQRNDSLAKVNEAQKTKLLTVTQILNKVEIPKNNLFFMFSGIKDITFDNNADSLAEVLHVNQMKTVVVHNIAAAARAGLVESDKPIADRSNFSIGFDTVVSQLGQIAAIVAKFTPFSSVLNFFLPTVKVPANIIDGIVRTPGDAISAAPTNKAKLGTVKMSFNNISGQFSVQEALNDILQHYNKYDSTLFNNNITHLPDPSLNQLNQNTAAMITLRAEYEKALKEYFTQLTEEQLNLLKADSFMVANFIEIFEKSTAPQTEPLEAIDPETPLFYSKTLATTPSENTIEKNVVVFTTIKDTVTLAKFKYKVGRNQRFALGAGIAYTWNAYDQSVAKELNGQISITNNVQLYRFVVGLHVYFGKGLFNLDNSFWGKGSERNFFFAGVGFPKPLENVYFGLGRDLVPGLKVTIGAHIAKNNRYLIQNNIIVEERLRYQFAGPFAAVTIDPTSLINLLNVFKN